RQWHRVLFALLFYPVTVLLALSALVGAFFPRFLRWGAAIWAHWFLVSARLAFGIRLRVRGYVPEEGIIAVKHQSMYETLAMAWLLRDPVVIMKKELRQIPVWGWVAERYGSIFVERTTRARALRAMLREARQHRAEGRPLLILPEG